MSDLASSRFVGVMASTLVVVLAASARAEDWRREVDALRPKDVTDRGAAVLDNLNGGPARRWPRYPRSDTARDAERMRGPRCRELERSLGMGRLPWPRSYRRWSVPAPAGLSHRESRL